MVGLCYQLRMPSISGNYYELIITSRNCGHLDELGVGNFRSVEDIIETIDTAEVRMWGFDDVRLSPEVGQALLRALRGHWHYRRSLVLPWSQLPFPRPIPEHLFAEIVEFL